MANTCAIPGTPELYGLGIRLSFYLLWLCMILSRWPPGRGIFFCTWAAHLLLAFAVFIGLVIKKSASRTLTTAEVYVTILLVSATVCYARVPYCTWRVITGFRRDLDPGLYSYPPARKRGKEGVPGGGCLGLAEISLLCCIIGLQLWFWIDGVDSDALSSRVDCEEKQQLGFLFAPVDLRSSTFRALNAIIVVAVLFGTIIITMADLGLLSKGPKRSSKKRRRRKVSPLQKAALKQLQTFCNLAVAAVLITAIELTILWNGIPAATQHPTMAMATVVRLHHPLGVVVEVA
ncbi:hypothetical protein B0H67DRAFT_643951 [Lasiosphaeris hirsuta]|uniref:Uncharacterized protein n=1 Tax=Lasiosphaeris hirsuta TaxID=260670 RepID=A0AA40ARM8_9PEZI|nr:hypothetical protein B0H67DRAFT_643951 [Lasiosphaeris hirsuta]